MKAKVLVTGAAGLIGSEVASHFEPLGYAVHGVDNNQRATFFGPQGDTRWRQRQLQGLPNYQHHDLDVRDRAGMLTSEDLGETWGDVEVGWTYGAGMRIGGGTDEILRNIIAERILGLPGEPRLDKQPRG